MPSVYSVAVIEFLTDDGWLRGRGRGGAGAGAAN